MTDHAPKDWIFRAQERPWPSWVIVAVKVAAFSVCGTLVAAPFVLMF
jgi:hypothetical protein